MRIYYDAGYNVNYNDGAYAIVLVDDDQREHLLDYGIIENTKCTSSGMEYYAADLAGAWAEVYDVDVVCGDFVPSLEQGKRNYPNLTWEYVRSRGNVADKFAKVYRCLL